jgi:cytochrome c-type biogenesis protein CcmH
MKQRRPLFLTLALVAIVGAAWSFVLLTTPPAVTLDQRVHDVASQLKCMVCQGESVADSPAELSQQMRAVIRQQLQEGKSEQEVIQYFVDRYGNSILLAPPWQGFSLLAWLVPIVMLLAGMILLFFVVREWHTTSHQTSVEDDPMLTRIDETELAHYRTQLEQELAADDPLFVQTNMEAS